MLMNEVNVIAFGGEDATTAVMSNLKLEVDVGDAVDRGWGRLDIVSSNATPMLWSLTGTDDGDVDAAAAGLDAGVLLGAPSAFTAVDDATDVAVVGFALWERSFAAQAGNYGRMIEHSTITSGSASR